MTVADSGPLIAFARIGQLELLHEVLGEVIIPDAVYQEVVVRGRGKVGASEVEASSWISRRAISDKDILDSIPARLHPGEREAISLALELGDRLLIDEMRGRAVAQEREVEVLGSLAVLAAAKQQGSIETVSLILETLLSSGYWLDQEIVAEFLAQMEEGG